MHERFSPSCMIQQQIIYSTTDSSCNKHCRPPLYRSSRIDCDDHLLRLNFEQTLHHSPYFLALTTFFVYFVNLCTPKNKEYIADLNS